MYLSFPETSFIFCLIVLAAQEIIKKYNKTSFDATWLYSVIYYRRFNRNQILYLNFFNKHIKSLYL